MHTYRCTSLLIKWPGQLDCNAKTVLSLFIVDSGGQIDYQKNVQTDYRVDHETVIAIQKLCYRLDRENVIAMKLLQKFFRRNK